MNRYQLGRMLIGLTMHRHSKTKLVDPDTSGKELQIPSYTYHTKNTSEVLVHTQFSPISPGILTPNTRMNKSQPHLNSGSPIHSGSNSHRLSSPICAPNSLLNSGSCSTLSKPSIVGNPPLPILSSLA